MHDSTIQMLSSGQFLNQKFYRESIKEEDNLDNYDRLPIDHDSFINNNWNDLSLLNEKFYELREKEKNGDITDHEKNLLYNVIEKRILEFPNPYLSSDHKKNKEAMGQYLSLEREFYKNRKKSGLFRLAKWLS